jgi:Na+/H+ antiporter NhaD/arsenite permease-like protein
VAAAMGMYELQAFPVTNPMWTELAFAAGTGGSILIIGSAAGVAVMGIEKIDFLWYLKNIAWLALAGFIAGYAVLLLMLA